MNMKKIIAGIMACCVVAGAVPVNAVEIADNTFTASAVDYAEGTYKQLTYKKYSDYVKISKCDSSATEIVIPAEIEGLPVTSIGTSAFSGCSGLTSITIPESVTSIGSFAFQTCSGLTSITIPESVTSIGGFAFYGCSGLTSITIPENITSIKSFTFSGCSGLTSITIPENVTSIETSAFHGCKGLTSITIPESVTSIGESVFAYCSGLTSITIPESVTSIGTSAFLVTPWLESKQKENPLVIAGKVLIDGTTCSGDVIIPDSVTSIGGHAFFLCSGPTSIIIPESVTNIGDYAFSGCSCLTSITILNPDCEIPDNDVICNVIDDTSYYNGIIYGYDNSTAQAYAEKYKREFISLGKAPEITTTTTTTAKSTTAKTTTTTTTKPTTTKTSATTVTTTAPTGKLLLGDANEDGEVNIADATAIIQHLGNKDKYALSEQGLANADCCNVGDGVTGLDALALQRLEAKQINKLPYTE